MNKRFYIVKDIFDFVIIFTPILFLFDNGVKNFLILFYLVYLPSLILSVIELRCPNKFKKPIIVKNKK
jgi:hypothetical protein